MAQRSLPRPCAIEASVVFLLPTSYLLPLTLTTTHTHYQLLLTTTHYSLPLTTYQASVVFLFLLPGLNARLRPTLAAQLRAAARVLSAEFQVSSR